MSTTKEHKVGERNKVTFNPETGEIQSDIPLSAYTQNDDALNPTLNQRGQGIGTHSVDINHQTDLELGALADPGGIEPASHHDFLEQMSDKITEMREGR